MNKKKKGYSVKPGRTRSAQGVAGGVFGIVFGIIWTIAAMSMGAPWFFGLFGVCFVAMAGYNTYINYKNATSQNRYSEFEIVDINDEPDPWDNKFRDDNQEINTKQDCEQCATDKGVTNFCPYCGTAAEENFEFCRSCGKKLPD